MQQFDFSTPGLKEQTEVKLMIFEFNILRLRSHIYKMSLTDGP